jgi:hypothetical protein
MRRLPPLNDGNYHGYLPFPQPAIKLEKGQGAEERDEGKPFDAEQCAKLREAVALPLFVFSFYFGAF